MRYIFPHFWFTFPLKRKIVGKSIPYACKIWNSALFEVKWTEDSFLITIDFTQ